MHIKNNFDFLRLMAATMVLISHQYALSKQSEPGVFGTSLGGLAVSIFFIISGYWVTKSWNHDPTLWRFIAKRLLRLLPALALVTTISIFIIGPVTTSETLNNYFHNNITWKYLNNIRLATKYELPGVFVDNPYPKAVNGSLWTLPVEAKWYLIVALFGLLRVINIKAVLIACFLALSCWLYVGELAAGGKNVDYFWSYGVFFLAGIFLTSYNGVSIKLVLWAVILSLPLIYFGYWFFGTLIALPPFIIYLGEQSNRYLCKISMMGDLSYGVYVFAFPVQQTLFHFFGLSLPFSISLSIVLLVTFTIAYFSWHFVELPSMNLKRYLYPRIATI